MTVRALAAALVHALVLAAPAFGQPVAATLLEFADLPGWAEDDLVPALRAFNQTCPDLEDAEWGAVCALASQNPPARAFFENLFLPVQFGVPDQTVFTGYYEPVIRASDEPGRGFDHPVLAVPPLRLRPGPSRAEIEDGALADMGLEIAWLRDPMDLYFLQMQGSGRLQLDDGRMIRLGFGARNGHPHRPIAGQLLRRGLVEPHQASARVIRNWAMRNPDLGTELRRLDPSYVFFDVLELSADTGPLGAMAQPLTAERSVAVDPRYVPLGAPVWIEVAGDIPIRRLMVAQDTGGAIEGPQRADIFFGTGPAAEDQARRVRTTGRLVTLLPIRVALSLL
jgi:membrane-bound lytic murein transglycosylase A